MRKATDWFVGEGTEPIKRRSKEPSALRSKELVWRHILVGQRSILSRDLGAAIQSHSPEWRGGIHLQTSGDPYYPCKQENGTLSLLVERLRPFDYSTWAVQDATTRCNQTDKGDSLNGAKLDGYCKDAKLACQWSLGSHATLATTC